MPSKALEALQSAIAEVKDLEKANPSPIGAAPTEPAITRAIGRASVVLLSSHFERYFYAVNEEVVYHLNSQAISSEKFPTEIRLLHTKTKVEEVAKMSWENRKEKLEQFASDEIWLWTMGKQGNLNHERLLVWMKAPSPQNLVRYYRYWEIQDIFQAITRTPTTLRDLRLRLQALVDKRNNIAHGDFSTEATQQDIKQYSEAIWTFYERADRKLSRQLRNLLGCTNPW